MLFTLIRAFKQVITQSGLLFTFVPCIFTANHAARPVIYIVPCILTAEPAAQSFIYIFRAF